MLVTGAGEFVGAHVRAELARAGHEQVTGKDERERSSRSERIDALVALSPERLRAALDEAALRGARVAVFLSALGADPRSERALLSSRGRAEEMVRAAGLPWVVLRPEILWGPGDVFTNELAHLLRHLPFVPVPQGGPTLAPVHVGDVAHAIVELLGRPDLWRNTWELPGPEMMSYAEALERVAGAIGLSGRRRLRVPAWTVRLGAALEERIAKRPRAVRELLDRFVAGDAERQLGRLPRMPIPERMMTVEALRQYLVPERSPAEQLAPTTP